MLIVQGDEELFKMQLLRWASITFTATVISVLFSYNLLFKILSGILLLITCTLFYLYLSVQKLCIR